MEEFKKSSRGRLVESYKSNTRRYDDGSIEIAPQEKGVPSQKDVKKVGRSKRYATTGKNPLTCIELKCPEEVPDKAAYIEITEPTLPSGEYLVNNDKLKVCLVKGEHPQLMAWLTFEIGGVLDVRKQLYHLTSEIEKCFAINEALVCQPK